MRLGARFRFKLPQGAERSFRFGSQYDRSTRMAIRVVLADDHVLVRQSLKSLLEREGFQVVAEASDGQEALRCVQSLKPDITVMDISMPILNGIEAARQMTLSSPHAKIILLTQHVEEQYLS